jgi:hypothetical protein
MPVSRDDSGEHPPRMERGLADLFSELARETSRLFRQEIALAKAELVGKMGQLGTGAVEMMVGGFLVYAGLLALVAAAILGLATVLQPWLAALVVGLVVIAIGAAAIFKGRRDIEPANLRPDRTLRTLREDAEWAREQMR